MNKHKVAKKTGRLYCIAHKIAYNVDLMKIKPLISFIISSFTESRDNYNEIWTDGQMHGNKL